MFFDFNFTSSKAERDIEKQTVPIRTSRFSTEQGGISNWTILYIQIQIENIYFSFEIHILIKQWPFIIWTLWYKLGFENAVFSKNMKFVSTLFDVSEKSFN